jgi:hypothetical protein
MANDHKKHTTKMPASIDELIAKGRREKQLDESEILALFDDPDSDEAQAVFDQLEELGVEVVAGEQSSDYGVDAEDNDLTSTAWILITIPIPISIVITILTPIRMGFPGWKSRRWLMTRCGCILRKSGKSNCSIRSKTVVIANCRL